MVEEVANLLNGQANNRALFRTAGPSGNRFRALHFPGRPVALANELAYPKSRRSGDLNRNMAVDRQADLAARLRVGKSRHHRTSG
jgi:hypothetical protein